MPDESTATLGQMQDYYKNSNANVSVDFGTPPRQGTVARNLGPNRTRVRPLPRPIEDDIGPIELPDLMLEPDTGIDLSPLEPLDMSAPRRRMDIEDHNVTAETRAYLMGLTELSCQYIDFSPEMCPGSRVDNGYQDPVLLETFKPGDKVWRTSDGTCFGPDTGEPYRPFYYNQNGREMDVMIHPVHPYYRLAPGCFERT